MTVEALKTQLGEFAKDTKLNMGAVLSEDGAPGLNPNQIYGTALASAYAVKNQEMIKAMEGEAAAVLSDAEVQAAKTAATIMAMNNIYYRFVHMVEDQEFKSLPAKLRMNAIGNPGIEKADFELYSLAVSAINGCGMCINAHVNELIKAGVSKLAIQSSIRIASVMNAVSQAITINQES